MQYKQSKSQTTTTMATSNDYPKVLHSQIKWEELFFFQKSNVLYQLTFAFCERFLPKFGDRTVDQMVQAARSGKQNIVEGLVDGVTSTEMQLKLLNVGRASIQELQQDFWDYLPAHKLPLWDAKHPRYDQMLSFCREHNKVEEYQPYFQRWSDEEMANIGYTLCKMTDKMMTSYIKQLEKEFVTQGGLKERMHAARTGYRQGQDERLIALEAENAALKAENAALRKKLEEGKL